MKIGLIPLDERPVNTRYPHILAAIAGADCVLPPDEVLSHFREPAQSDSLIDWLTQTGGECDALIVSCEMLGYGSLIQSRVSHEPASAMINRLEKLRTLKARNPNLRIFGFNLITRISRANDSTEEPLYWAEHGANLYRYSQLLDQAEQGQPVQDELNSLRASLPAEHIRDFLGRRLRNHTVNLAALQLLADGVFDLLVMSSDDTSPYGLGSREKGWISEWIKRLKIGDRLLMYPGADEVGSILVARAINERTRRWPRFEVAYAVPGGEDITAAFEDSAVRVTVERQIRAAGGTIVNTDGDIKLMVNPPRSPDMDWPMPYHETEQRERLPHLQAAIQKMRTWADSDKIIAVADVAHANGADNLWVDLMRQAGLLTHITAYSAWNTAGNSLGTTIAHASLASLFKRDSQAQKQFLAHRLIEDWLYQGMVRTEAMEWLQSRYGTFNLSAEMVEPATHWIEQHLSNAATGMNMGFRIKPGSLRLPWKRTFEIDFELDAM